ncbi:hypothetical protein N7451_007630 [Penicillium sp. IBT 35674x]|nr:hypothetical protein N7451_007630 [Penicillium sp. IBT 35674x]
MERQLLSDQWIAEDNGPFLWQIHLPASASKEPSKLGRLFMAIKQRIAAGVGSLRWDRRAQPDIAEALQGDADSSISTGVWSPVSGDVTGSSLVRAVWKRWKHQLSMKRDGRQGEAHDTGWRRALSLHRELQERRLATDMMARIGK